MDVIVMGHPKSRATRAALRFFAERRVPVHDRDLRKRATSPKELRRWVDKLGVDAVIDTASPAYLEQGLGYLSLDVDGWLERLTGEPTLLRLPLVRYEGVLVVGEDPDGWQRVVDAVRRA